MSTSYYRADTIAISSGLKWSAGIHLFIVLFLVIKPLVAPNTAKRYIPTLRVDVVDLPDHLKSEKVRVGEKQTEKAAEKEKEKPKEVEKPAEKEKIPTFSKKKKKAEEKKKDAKKEETKAEKEREKKMASALARAKALAKLDEETVIDKVKGNQLSKGSVIDGQGKASLETNYYDHVLSKLKSNWTLPIWLSRQELAAKVTIFIDSTGRVRDFKFESRSGNEKFDDAVITAINKSAPFEIPPKEIKSTLNDDGVLLGFPL